MRIILAALLVCLSLSVSFAKEMTFNVDLTGTSDRGNELRVFGTLRVDPAIPIDNFNVGPASLFVQRDAELPIKPLNFLILAIPNESSGTVQMEWTLLGHGLYVTRTSSEDSSIVYTGFDILSSTSASFNLGSGVYDHTITFNDGSGSETAILKAASGSDGPNGFLVGTAVVPEPSSISSALTGLYFVGVSTYSRSRRRAARSRELN